ncbi:BCS1 [Scenedesmus sp. PABB004]|nr:BCS1 [Scenedesmus sp. PABB004]
MRVAQRTLLDAALAALAAALPGRRGRPLLPWLLLPGGAAAALAAGGWPRSARADALAPAPPERAAGGGDGGLPAVLAKLLGDNQIASGGLTLAVLGGSLAAARLALGAAVQLAARRVMIRAEVDSRDDAYRWIMAYLADHPRFKRATSVSVTSSLSCFGATGLPVQPLTGAGADDEGAPPPVTYLPAPGDHLLRHRGRWMLISRRRGTGNPQLAANARLLMETLTITLPGTDRAPLDALIRDAAAAYRRQAEARTLVHAVDADGYWTQVGSRPKRPLSTVVLPEGQAQALLADCREFLSAESEAWYAHHGIPYRRGYLLYGPPGTGKTSLVHALAGALGVEIYAVSLSSPTMSDEALRNLLNTAGVRSILLLEDVDAAFVSRQAGDAASRLTFSGLLNAIDGVAAQEGRLLFLTTNHVERLSGALIRPGRVDVRCLLGPATAQQARLLFLSFYRDLPHLPLTPGGSLDGDRDGGAGDGDAPAAAPEPGGAPPGAARDALLSELADAFVARLPDAAGVSMAALQGFLMTHRKDPWAAVRHAGTLAAAAAAAPEPAASSD